ncbi:type II secretion system F family protein [Nocardioides speluncae]|uniref:type II secretion system F family protein n=1 Tax=Nocardioides speluncae TaxID=2670337 RepID=UPI000D68D4FC|nr:type II secretion system F family protein [Nocardioides speluncae]
MSSALIAALALTAAVLLATPPPPRWPRPVAPEAPGEPDERGALVRYRWLLSLLAGIGAHTFANGPVAPIAGVAAAAATYAVIVRMEPPALRRRREQCRRELPHLVGFYAAALRSGSAPAEALGVVCAALPGAAADELAPTCARLRLGVPPGEVWGDLAAHAALGPLGRAMTRAHASGASVTTTVAALADDLAAQARGDAEDRARTVGVKAAVPLGLCLLPAFLLIGIVPLVAGALSALDW